jgi:hypothetical protein
VGDVVGERDVGFAAQVGDVDAGPPAVDEDAVGLGEDAVEHLEVLFEAQIGVVFFICIIRRRRDH